MRRDTISRLVVMSVLLSVLLSASVGCSEAHVALDGSLDAHVSRPDGSVDAHVSRPDGGPPPLTCDAMDARTAVCPLACDGPPTFYWDGGRCFAIGCGECEGADCDRGFPSLDACESARASCDATLCRASGGDWLSAPLYCGHHLCGEPAPAICEVGGPVCNCGPARTFVFEAGCVVDPTCPVPDPEVNPEALCRSTGGTWADTCCPSTCGVPCDADCIAPACTCGALQVWSGITGCTDASSCMERQRGEICTSTSTRCADGLLCCLRCGGAGCASDATCEIPVCDDDPSVDTCGNDLFAP